MNQTENPSVGINGVKVLTTTSESVQVAFEYNPMVDATVINIFEGGGRTTKQLVVKFENWLKIVEQVQKLRLQHGLLEIPLKDSDFDENGDGKNKIIAG